MSKRHVALAALVVLASLVPMAAATTVAQSDSQSGAQAEGAAYAGTHVAFESNGSALVDYSVDGDTIASTVEVQSASEVEGGLGLGANADAVTAIPGAALGIESTADAAARVQVDSGATIEAHDHSHGTLVVDADSEQYVALGLNASSEAEAESEKRALVTTDNGSTAAVMVVGEGNVTVNDDGNLTAAVGADSKLVVRSYSEERTDADERTEELIVEGTAAAEVYVDEQDGETVTGTVTYDSNTTVEFDSRTESTVNMTVERTEHEGKVVVASASQFSAESAEDVTVRVDGDVAAQASSYSDLRAATNNGSTSKYMVRNSASAEADAEVLVGVNHFSERSVSMSDSGSSGDGSDASNDSDADATTSGDGPGFGVVAALLALVGLVGRAVTR